MEIITKTEENKVTMEISGWLDTQTAPRLEEALSELDEFARNYPEAIDNYTRRCDVLKEFRQK